MREVTKTVFLYDELNDKAKEKARDWYRDLGLDTDWYDHVYEEAEQFGNLFGVEFKQKPVKLVGGGTRTEPAIWFSGFASQGDGACFEGRYAYAKNAAAKLKAHIDDPKLTAIVEGLQAIQKAHGYRLTATVVHSGHYYHSGCTDIEVMKGDADAPADAEAQIKRHLRDFMDWIYRELEATSDALEFDESVAENIIANEYEFEYDGTRTRD